MDIISTWRSLGPELSCESRPLMVKAIAELLALVSQLTVKSEEYEVNDQVHNIVLMCVIDVFVNLVIPKGSFSLM